MEIVSGKRTLDSETTVPVDTFAVCNKCNRLSKNLKVCDNCSSPLSEDNSAQCYSSDPKRPRIEGSSPTPPAPVSQSSEQNSTPTTVNGTSEPNMDVSSNSVRPEALFVNVNHQAFPVLGVGSGSGTSATQRPVVLTAQASAQQTVTVNGTGAAPVRPRALAPASTTTPPTPNGDPIFNSAVRTTMLNSQATSLNTTTSAQRTSNSSGFQPTRPTTTSQMMLPTYNLQPPPPPFSSNVARLPVSSSAPIPAVVSSGGAMQTISIPALQIRIGTKKFKPISPVTFKDDGILFTLKDYTYAPVLLNARAIVKCKANLNTFSYPALFLFLENSCMRQIRNIFGLTSSEFAGASPVELKRCITIFPIFGTEGKAQVQQMMYSIKRSFEAMVRRYPRSSSILEEITNDQVIDILLDVSDGSGSDAPNEGPDCANTNTSCNTSSAAVTSAPEPPSVPSTVITLNAGQNNNTTSTVLQTRSMVQSSLSEVSMTNSLSTASSHVVSQPSQANKSQGQASAPVLVIPSDSTRWQMIQKSLVVGGVYHVMMPTGQRKYCLWNGTQLVPCLVQNTEVQLACARIRFGSALVQCVGQVRIRADHACGIYFTVKNDQPGVKEIAITPGDITSCHICFGARITVLFILTTWLASDKLSRMLGLVMGSDRKFDVNSTDLKKRSILLFLNDVNKDQEEALTLMKYSHQNLAPQPMFKVIDFTKANTILAEIIHNTQSSFVISNYIEQQRLYGSVGFEKLAHNLCDSENGTTSTEDDDDDVIMTQEELGVKCPYTQQVMKDPVRNVICGHNYEKAAIHEFIVRRKGNAKCPYAGCGNIVPLRQEDLQDNLQLKEYIMTSAGAGS